MKKLNLLASCGAFALLSGCAAHNQALWCEVPEPIAPVVEVQEQTPPPPPPPPAKQIVTEQVTLSADALFKFDKHSDEDMLSHQSLDDLTHKLNTGYATISGIHLVGHTDRLGSEQYNHDLGLKRAQTVGRYLQKQGITSPITVESKGETQPVTTDCVGNKANADLIKCLQPDRRVDVNISGVRRYEK